MPQPSPIKQQTLNSHQQRIEPDVVVPSHAIVDPDTVMILLLYAHFTDRAMFRAGGFCEVACGAEIAGVEERVVVGVREHC